MNRVFSNFKYYIVSIFLLIILGVSQLLATDNLSLSPISFDDSIASGSTVSIISGSLDSASGAVVFSLIPHDNPTAGHADDYKYFEIIGDSLVIRTDPDYILQDHYEIGIRESDNETSFDQYFILSVNDKTVPEFSSITVSSSNTNTGYAKAGDSITFSLNLGLSDSSSNGNNLSYDLGVLTGQTLTFDQNAGALLSHTKSFFVQPGQSGSFNIAGLTFTDNAGNVLSGFTLPYSLSSNIIVDTTVPTINIVDNVSNSSNLTDDINIVVTDDNLDTSSLMYGFSADATCDITDSYTISYVSGNTFTISDTLNNGKYLCIKASDYAGNTMFNMSTYPLNIATVGIALSGTGINENLPSGTTIGDFSTLYSTGTTFTYELVAGSGDTDNLSFSITGTTLSTQFNSDFETKSFYNIRVRSTDENTNVVENEFTIYINDVNEQPTDITLSGSTLPEGISIGTIVGEFLTTDEDTGASHTYSFISGTGSNNNVNFSISGSNLIAEFETDYEAQSSYSILVRSTDNGGLTIDEQFTITVIDSPESPTDIDLTNTTLVENTASGTLVGDLSSTDQDAGDTFTYTLVAGTGSDDNASFSITGTGLYIEEVPNFEAKATYNILIRSTDSFGQTYDEQFTIIITNDNESSTDVTLTPNSVDENTPSGTVVGTLSTTDQDVGDTFTYSYTAIMGVPNDNAMFTLSGNTISTNFSPNFEAKSSYTLTLNSEDSGNNNLNKVITVTINDVNENPTDISISSNSIDENLGAGVSVGTLGTIDQDTDTYTYTLVAGTGDNDNGSFSISGSTLVADFNGDFETQSGYTVRVRSTDAGLLTTEKQFSITINDLNNAPTDLTLSGSTIDENQLSGTLIGDLTGTDDGENNGSLTYSFTCSTGGVDDASFTISGSTLLSNGTYNFETNPTYNICIRVSDGTLNFDKDFTITVNDINETPTDISLSNNNIDENLGAGVAAGTLGTVDQDIDSHTYTLVTGTGDDDNGSFSISGATLVADFNGNYETQSGYTLRVRSTDAGGLNTEKQINITINDLNNAPSDLTLSGTTIPENSSIGTIIGTFNGTDDGENNGALTYDFTCSTGGIDDTSFSISGSTLSSNGTYNFETKPTYNICVRVSDGTLSFDKDFVVNISDVNEAPTDIAITNDNINENVGTGTTVGTFASIDQDSGDTYTYSLVSGTGSDNNASFSITGTTLIAEFDPNFEVKSSYLIRVRSTDAGGLSSEKELTITINDLNLAPSDLTLSGSTILENTFVGTTIGTFIGTDDGEDNGALTYSLACTTGSVDDAKFSILGSTLRTATTINFESGATLSICVKVSDGVLSLDKNFTIDIGNVNESPYNFIFTQNSFDENTATGFLVGNLSSQDEDTGDTHIYDFGTGLGSTDNSSFTMSGGEVYASFSPNYENKNLYQVKFKVTDSGGITTDLQNTVIVNDLNEAPSDITLSNDFIDENVGTGALVGLFDSTDEDLGDNYTYTLVAGIGSADNGSFNVVGNALITDFVGDYETKSTYSIRLRTTDSGGLTREKQFTIYLNDVDETGVFITLSGSTLSENAGTGISVGTFATTTSFSGATSFTYTMVAGTGSADNASFSISGSTLISQFDGDYETKAIYNIRVRSTDNLLNSTEEEFTINLLNQNEQATDINLSASSIDENTSGVYIVGNLSTIDEDTTDTYTYNLVGGVGSNDNASFTIVGNTLLSGFTPDYETKNAYYIRVRSTDSGGLTTEKQFTITINDLLENPSDISFSGSTTIVENTASGVTLGSFSTTGTNTGVTYTYTLSGTGGDNASFTITGDNLITNFVPDYESQNIYNVLVRSTDSLGYFFEESFAITITNTNETPTLINLSSTTIAENLSAGATVGTVTTTDQDLGDSHNYSFITGTGSDDNASFSLSGNILLTNFVSDYEVKNSYLIRLRSIDFGGLTTENQFTITVNNTNLAPTDITLSANNIDENSAIGTTIGTLTGADDGENNGTLDYSFTCATPGVDDNSFTLSGTTLSSNAVFNYESQNSYNICVRLSDGSLSYDENFVININNLVENPTDIVYSGSLSIDENTASGYTMGSFSSVGVNTGVTYTYTLVAGTGSDDNASFTISGDNLITAFNADYEIKNNYTIRVRTTDTLAAIYEEQFTFTVNDSNNAPTDIALSGSTVDENMSIGTLVGTISGTDDGENNGSFIYSLSCATGGVDDSSFSLSGTNLSTNQVFNYELQNSYNICIRLSDGTLNYDENFTITVNNTEEAPTDIALSSTTISEGSISGTTVGNFSTTDQDGGVHTYTLVAGTGSADNASFTISGNNLVTAFTADFESKNSYNIRIRSTDAGLLYTEKQFTITVNNINNPPSDIALSGSTINENAAIGTFIGTVSGTDDGEDNGTLAFSLNCATGGVDDGYFTLSGTTLTSFGVFDYEAKSSYNICVRVSDGTYNYDENFVVLVNDIIESPTDIALSGSTVPENSSFPYSIGDFSTTGTNSGATYLYSLILGTGSDDNASFTISGSTLLSAFVPNYETKNTYSIRVQSTDSFLQSLEKQFNISVSDVNLAPTDITLSGTTINENDAIGTTIGTVTGTDDGENNGTLSFGLTCATPGLDDVSFTLSGTTITNNLVFDYETKNTYNICVRVTDGSLTYDENFVISVNDITEAADIVFSGSLSIQENTISGYTLGDFSTTGSSGSTSYAFITGTGSDDNASFTISGATLSTNFVPNYEAKNTYTILVRSTDSLLATVDKQFTITISNVNLAPTDIALSNNNINENLAAGTTVGNLSGTDDGENNGTLSYSLTCATPGVDDASFAIAGTTLSNTSVFDYETKNTYNICIRVTDGTLTYDENFVISVNDVAEGINDITFSGSLTLAENNASGLDLGNFNSVGTSSGTITYSLVAGTGSNDNASFTLSGSNLITSFAPNYEVKNTYSIRVRTTDSNGILTEKQFSIIISDVNETPSDVNLSNSNFNENLSAGITVGTFTTTDVDTGNSFTYTLVAGAGSDNNGSFGISGANLVANFTADYETKNSYTVRIRTTDNGGLFTEKQFTISIGNVNEGSSGGGGGGGGGYALYKDDCPSGDFSPSYYDRNCGTKPKTGSGTTSGTGKTNTGSTMTGSTSTGSTDTSFEEKVEKIIDKSFKDVKFENENGEEFIIRKTVTGQFVVKKVDGDYEDKVFPKVDDAKKYINALTKFEVINLGDYDFDEEFVPIIYVSRYGDRFMARKLTNGKYILFTEKGLKLNGTYDRLYQVLRYLQDIFGKNAFLPSKHTI